jgi:hypothetical protein
MTQSRRTRTVEDPQGRRLSSGWSGTRLTTDSSIQVWRGETTPLWLNPAKMSVVPSPVTSGTCCGLRQPLRSAAPPPDHSQDCLA